MSSHDAAIKRYALALDSSREQRERMLEDLRFSNPSDPQQWDEGARRVREQSLDGARPCLVLDQTNQFIQQVVNDGRQNKPSIQILPVGTGADQKVATALEGLVRDIEYKSQAGTAYDTALDCAARAGLGWMHVRTVVSDPELNQQEIRIDRVADCLSVKAGYWEKPDGSDMPYGFVDVTMTKSEFERKYPGKRVKPLAGDDVVWFGQDMVRVAEYYWLSETKKNNIVIERDGKDETLGEDDYHKLDKKPSPRATYVETKRKVKWRLMSGAEWLTDEREVPSDYIPLIPVIGDEIWIEGVRYLSGMPRRMRSAQQAYNYASSAEVETLALQPRAPWTVAWESVADHQEEWGRANTSNQAFLPYNARDEHGEALPPPRREAPPQLAAAFTQASLKAREDLQASVGMYRSNLGAPSNAVSGRAKMQDQREGDTANFHYIDNLARSIEHVGRIIVGMIPVIYDTKREVQMLGSDGTSKAVTIDPDMPDPAKLQDGKVVSINPTTGKYGVRVKTGPAYSTLRQQTSEFLGELLARSPQLVPILGPTWMRMQDMPEAEKVSRMLLAMAPPPVQAIEAENEEVPPAAMAQIESMKQQMQQMQEMLQQATQAANEVQMKRQIEEEKLKFMAEEAAHRNQLEQMKLQLLAQDQQQKMQLSMYDAETKRMTATKPEAQQPMDDGSVEAVAAQTEYIQDVHLQAMKDETAVQIQQMKDDTALTLAGITAQTTLASAAMKPPPAPPQKPKK